MDKTTKIIGGVIVIIVVIVAAHLLFKSADEPKDNYKDISNSMSINKNSNTTNTNASIDPYSSSSSTLPNTFNSPKYGVKIRYPIGFTPNENFQYELNPTTSFSGISFKVPTSFTTGTNLSPDSYISWETIPGECNALNLVPYQGATEQTITDDSKSYSFVISGGVAAGNQYEERVYAWKSASGCYAFRYFTHTSSVENYPEGTVKEYNKQELLKVFDEIRRDFVKYNS